MFEESSLDLKVFWKFCCFEKICFKGDTFPFFLFLSSILFSILDGNLIEFFNGNILFILELLKIYLLILTSLLLICFKKEIATLDPKLKGDFTKLFLEVKFSFSYLLELKTLGILSVITFKNRGDYLFKF